MNIITIEKSSDNKNTVVKVNGEYICEIKGTLKAENIPEVDSTVGKSKRYGNCHGHVWVSIVRE